jgi:hypothetical protein
MAASRLRTRHRNGSNEYFDRGQNPLRYCNMRCWLMFLLRVISARSIQNQGRPMSALAPIVLQKSKVAGPRIFRENMNREATADSYSLNRVTEVACEFNVSR